MTLTRLDVEGHMQPVHTMLYWLERVGWALVRLIIVVIGLAKLAFYKVFWPAHLRQIIEAQPDFKAIDDDRQRLVEKIKDLRAQMAKVDAHLSFGNPDNISLEEVEASVRDEQKIRLAQGLLRQLTWEKMKLLISQCFSK